MKRIILLVLLGVVVLGERFGPATAIGFVLVLSGSVLATRPLRSKAVPSSAVETKTETETASETREALERPRTVAAPTVAEPTVAEP